MHDPFVGSEALAAGFLTPYELRSRYVALHKDVYLPKDAELTAVLRAQACWLRSRRRGVAACAGLLAAIAATRRPRRILSVCLAWRQVD
jgi:hypothetical protein